jgi:small-conductance mechanosensitive channel
MGGRRPRLRFIAAILALDRLGIPLTTLVAPATVIGIGLGFGAQQMVGDLLAGFFLFAEHQFAFGDVIRLSVPGQTTGITGTVEELTLRVTKVRTAQGELVVVPNSALRQVTNLSKDWSRAVIDIPVSVTEDLEYVTGLLKDMSAAMAADPDWSGLFLGEPGGGRGRDHRCGLRAAPAHRPDVARPAVRGGDGDPAAGGHHTAVGRRHAHRPSVTRPRQGHDEQRFGWRDRRLGNRRVGNPRLGDRRLGGERTDLGGRSG